MEARTKTTFYKTDKIFKIGVCDSVAHRQELYELWMGVPTIMHLE